MSHLLVSGPFNMVFKHFRNSFDLGNSTSGFIQLCQLCSHVVVYHIPRFVIQIFGASWLLVLAKVFSGIHPIEMGETFY
jgi:fucose permease